MKVKVIGEVEVKDVEDLGRVCGRLYDHLKDVMDARAQKGAPDFPYPDVEIHGWWLQSNEPLPFHGKK